MGEKEMNNLDEKMKALLLSKGEHVIVSVYDSDLSHQNRKNSKRAKLMEKLINEGGFEYKRIRKPPFQNGEVQIFFVVYGDTEKFKSLVEEMGNAFHVVNYYDDLAKILEDVAFYHPYGEEETKAYRKRKELFLEDLTEKPVQHCDAGINGGAENQIPWKTIVVQKDGRELKAHYWSKDYTVYCEWNAYNLNFGRHMMYMAPMKYTEEKIRGICEESFNLFDQAIAIIEGRKDFFDARYKEISDSAKEAKEENEQICAKIRELKKQLKAGSIENKEYGKKVHALNEEKQSLWSLKWNFAYEVSKSLGLEDSDVQQIIRNYLEVKFAAVC